jgi:hypothetical protein
MGDRYLSPLKKDTKLFCTINKTKIILGDAPVSMRSQKGLNRHLA